MAASVGEGAALVRVVDGSSHPVQSGHAEDQVESLELEHPELEIRLVLAVDVDGDGLSHVSDGHGGSGWETGMGQRLKCNQLDPEVLGHGGRHELAVGAIVHQSIDGQLGAALVGEIGLDSPADGAGVWRYGCQEVLALLEGGARWQSMGTEKLTTSFLGLITLSWW